MKYLVSNEIIKLFQSKSFLKQLLFIILPVLFISFMEIYLIENRNSIGDFLSIQKIALSLSSIIIFPFAVCSFFPETITTEIEFKSNKLLFGSKYSPDKIYLAKFIAASAIVIINFILAMIIEFAVLSIFTNIKNINISNILIRYFNVEYKFAIIKSIIVWTINMFYFISLGSLSMLLILYTKNKYTATIIIFCIIACIIAIITIIPLPSSFTTYSLIYPIGSFELFSSYDINGLEIFKMISISLIYTTAFLICGSFVSLRKKIF